MRPARIAPLCAALVLAFASAAPDARAQGETPPQCRDLGAIVDFHGGNGHFQNYGLSADACRALCRQWGGHCKSFLKLSGRCARKAIDAQRAIDERTLCAALEDGAARKACRKEQRQEAADAKAAYDADVAELSGGCDFVRDSCSVECGS